jgi:hypothetical protein
LNEAAIALLDDSLGFTLARDFDPRERGLLYLPKDPVDQSFTALALSTDKQVLRTTSYLASGVAWSFRGNAVDSGSRTFGKSGIEIFGNLALPTSLRFAAILYEKDRLLFPP